MDGPVRTKMALERGNERRDGCVWEDGEVGPGRCREDWGVFVIEGSGRDDLGELSL